MSTPRWRPSMVPAVEGDSGGYVSYPDHVAAVAEAVSFGYEQAFEDGARAERACWAAVTDEPDSHALGVYKAGIHDERARIRQAAEAMRSRTGTVIFGQEFVPIDALLAVIDKEDV